MHWDTGNNFWGVILGAGDGDSRDTIIYWGAGGDMLGRNFE